jgi:hypothetical protein
MFDLTNIFTSTYISACSLQVFKTAAFTGDTTLQTVMTSVS